MLLPMLLIACTPSVIDGGFDSPMAASRLYAIEQSVRQGDASQIRRIIEQLESDDPAVRLLAIGALERLTQRTYGYHHEDDPLTRRSAIQRWREAYESGELDEVIHSKHQTEGAGFSDTAAGTIAASPPTSGREGASDG